MVRPIQKNTRTQIPAHFFTDPRIFEKEQEVIFRATWQFFCLTTDLKGDQDFVTGDVGGIPVVVQNFKGKLRAFQNVCSHRYSPIQTACSGNRPLVCPYHGWKYAETGVPLGIPHNLEFYPITSEEKCQLALRSFKVETCGNFVFVSIACERSLREQLGEWHELLGRIGQGVDDVYFTTQLESDCNWKFVVENAFDDIHAEFVHPTASLDTSVYTGSRWEFHPYSSQTEDLPRDYSKRHAQLTVSMSDATVERNEQLWSEHFPDRAHRFPDYLHLFVYPNLILTSVQGFWYNLVHYKPISAERSQMTHWLIPARPASGPSRVTPELLYRLALGSLRVFEEDVRAVEVTQPVIRSVRQPGILGQRENKIASFESAYMDLMAAVTPA
jgi:phenylpropionate dioxygenase-like ring-hydroxylating dioxygenase large terminal subunit